MLWFVVRLLLLAIPSFVYAEQTPVVGASFYSMMNPRFPCREAMRVYRGVDTVATSILWGTFGYSQRCLKQFFQTAGKRPVVIEVHLSNEVCRRNRRCFEGELLGKISASGYNRLLERKDERTTEIFVRRLYQILRIMERLKTPQTRVILSTGLEDNYSRKAYTYLFSVLRQHWPADYEIARNPLKSAYRGRADFLEYHGRAKRPKGRVIWNGDGVHSLSEQERLFRRGTTLSFFWEGASQGLYQTGFVRPYHRVFQVQEARRINRMMRAKLAGN